MEGRLSLSPSGAERWMSCPGSVHLTKDLPRGGGTEYSRRGTAAHEAAMNCILKNISPESAAKFPIQVEGEEVTLDGDDIAAIQVYRDYVVRRIQEIENCSMELESRFDCGYWLGREMPGLIDCYLYGPREIEIIDYKHGAGIQVEVYNNPQIMLYALAVCATMQWEDKPTDYRMTLTIVQPRCPHPDGPIRQWETTPWELFERIGEFTAAIQTALDPNAPRVPGQVQCRFCPGKTICPEAADKALQVFNIVENSNISGWEAKTPTENPSAPPATKWDTIEKNLGVPVNLLSLEEKVRALEAENYVKEWFKAVREDLTKQALNGIEVPRHKLVVPATRRRWSIDDDKIIKRMAGIKSNEGRAIGKDTVCKVAPITPAQAEKIIKPKCTERSWTALEKLMVKPEGVPVLAPDTDSREAIPVVTDVFKPESAPMAPAPWE